MVAQKGAVSTEAVGDRLLSRQPPTGHHTEPTFNQQISATNALLRHVTCRLHVIVHMQQNDKLFVVSDLLNIVYNFGVGKLCVGGDGEGEGGSDARYSVADQSIGESQLVLCGVVSMQHGRVVVPALTVLPGYCRRSCPRAPDTPHDRRASLDHPRRLAAPASPQPLP
ncbi:hypothetical protein J6590_006862 [Homalodisca vitripennis]|nr:hypothetical protein J6590_006862 [Homalodisca vitripennis]